MSPRPKFKVGDKVRFRDEYLQEYFQRETGRIGTREYVADGHGAGSWHYGFTDRRNGMVMEKLLELVPEGWASEAVL